MQGQQQPISRGALGASSIAGEEDPGAALDVVRQMVQAQRRRAASPQAAAPADVKIQLSCSNGRRHIQVGVTWPHHADEDAADLLGLVVAHHGDIADQAWRLYDITGEDTVELEVDEAPDGTFHVSRAHA